MLRELTVKNLGIIESINWALEDGLNIITGETGAGKSLVIDAIEALVEGKTSDEDIRSGASETLVDGVFDISNASGDNLISFLTEKGLVDESGTLVMSCDVRRQGRATVRVNGHVVSRSILQRIASMLIDIHGQSDHLSLLDKRTHIDYLDAYAHITTTRERFRTMATQLAATEEVLRNLETQEKVRARREEHLRYEIAEIERAKLKVGEDEELERERQVLSSIEELKTLSYQAYGALCSEDNGLDTRVALDYLRDAGRVLKKLSEVDPRLVNQAQALETSAIELVEIAREIHQYNEGLEYDPERLQTVESRLELIANIKRKYGDNIEQVLAYLDKARKELMELAQSFERRAEAEKACALLRKDMASLAYELSSERDTAAGKMLAEVEKELKDLGLGEARFTVSVNQTKSDAGLSLADGSIYVFNQYGIDDVEFMASTNLGEPVKPLVRIASTGEMSRFMLAIKSVLGAVDKTPVLVFDEIDIGVGGRSGEIIGKKLWRLARSRQVICVTHLPQIAAFGDAHFRVFKETSGGRTLSVLSQLRGEARVRELAVMLTGAKLTDSSIKTGRGLLKSAGLWKAAESARR